MTCETFHGSYSLFVEPVSNKLAMQNMTGEEDDVCNIKWQLFPQTRALGTIRQG